MCECFACMFICTTCVPGAHGGRKKASDPLEMELQTIVSHHVVLGTKHRSFSRTSALNYWAIFSAPIFYYFNYVYVCIWMLVLLGDRKGYWIPCSWSTGSCKLSDIGTGNQTQALQEQYIFLTTWLTSPGLRKFSLKSRWLPPKSVLWRFLKALLRYFVPVIVVGRYLF